MRRTTPYILTVGLILALGHTSFGDEDKPKRKRPISQKLAELEERVGKLEDRQSKLDEKLVALDEKLAALDERGRAFETETRARLHKLESLPADANAEQASSETSPDPAPQPYWDGKPTKPTEPRPEPRAKRQRIPESHYSIVQTTPYHIAGQERYVRELHWLKSKSLLKRSYADLLHSAMDDLQAEYGKKAIMSITIATFKYEDDMPTDWKSMFRAEIVWAPGGKWQNTYKEMRWKRKISFTDW